MPGFTGRFEYDVFVSYAHEDDRYGWVGEFIRRLKEEVELTLQLRTDSHDRITIRTFNYKTLPNFGALDPLLEDSVRNSAVFVPVLSDVYILKEHTRRELEIFGRDPGRTFPIVKEPLQKGLPEELLDLIYVEFLRKYSDVQERLEWNEGPGGVPGGEIVKKVEKLALGIAKRLQQLLNDTPTARKQGGHSSASPSTGHPTQTPDALPPSSLCVLTVRGIESDLAERDMVLGELSNVADGLQIIATPIDHTKRPTEVAKMIRAGDGILILYKLADYETVLGLVKDSLMQHSCPIALAYFDPRKAGIPESHRSVLLEFYSDGDANQRAVQLSRYVAAIRDRVQARGLS